MERVEGFDLARGAAVVMVVVLHATALSQGGTVADQPVSRMGLMMLISGILSAPALERRRAYAANRAVDLLWLYVVWTPLTLVATRGAAGLRTLPGELVAPATPLWYIGGLAMLSGGMLLLRGVRPVWPLAISAAAALLIATGHRSGVLGYDQFLHFAVFFFVGVYGRPHILAMLARCGARTAATAAAVLALMLLTPAIPHPIASVVAGLALLPIAQGLVRLRGVRHFGAFGRRTLDVYLMHCPLLWIAARLIGPYGAGTTAALAIAVIVACLLLRRLCDRFGLGWLYRRPPLALSLPVPPRLRPLLVPGS